MYRDRTRDREPGLKLAIVRITKHFDFHSPKFQSSVGLDSSHMPTRQDIWQLWPQSEVCS